jgi:hypothetical protein
MNKGRKNTGEEAPTNQVAPLISQAVVALDNELIRLTPRSRIAR